VTLKDLVWVLYLFPLRWLSRILPCRLFLLGGAVFAPLLGLLGRSHRREIAERVRQVALLKGAGWDAEHIARASIRHAIRRGLEDLVIDRLCRRLQARPPEMVGLAHLQEALAEGRGAIVVSGHFYGNRLGKRYLATQGLPTLSVRNRTPGDRRAGRFGKAVMQSRYLRFLHWVIGDEISPQDPDCGLRILSRLREGGLVNIHLDGAVSRQCLDVDFLDGIHRFPAGFLEIVRLTGTPVVPMLITGHSECLKICFAPEIVFDPAPDAGSYARANLARLVQQLESDILTYPDQWELWIRL
jgi:lauroyl/myristoyl acyltransferase